MSTTELTIRTSRGDIFARETSSGGMPLVMLHGSGASGAVFARQMDGPLGDAWRIIALDLPGHGRSSDSGDPAQDYTLPGLASIVGEALDTLGLERFALLGWSLGGHIAIELLAARPEIAGLLLCGTPPLGKGPIASFRAFRTSWDLLLGSKEQFTERDTMRFLRICFGDAADPQFIEDIRRADGRLRATAVRSMMRGDGVDQRHVVEHAEIPVAMVNGAEEPIARLSYIEGLDYASLWEGRCHTIVGAGHSPFWQAPERFNVLLHRFMTAAALPARVPADAAVGGDGSEKASRDAG